MCMWAGVEGAKKYLYQSQQWHEDCFKCTECTSSIGTSSFIPHEGQPVCVGCYHDKFAIKCVKCNGVSVTFPLQAVKQPFDHNRHGPKIWLAAWCSG